MSALTFAVLAVALSPFAYWELGHLQGRSPQGSSPTMRRLFVLAYFGCILAALYEVWVQS